MDIAVACAATARQRQKVTAEGVDAVGPTGTPLWVLQGSFSTPATGQESLRISVAVGSRVEYGARVLNS
ncbi:MAG: hypothetical protein ABEJ43_06295, partial [Haloferacaceae archaeon]